jgi:hypothetical protein
MNIEELSPEELREYAVAKENAREALTAKYMSRPANLVELPERKPWEKTVEYDGYEFDLDMRKLHSRDFVKKLAELQGVDAEEQGFGKQIELFEAVFDGTRAYEQVKAYVIEKCGFEDYIEVLRVEGELFALVDVKN